MAEELRLLRVAVVGHATSAPPNDRFDLRRGMMANTRRYRGATAWRIGGQVNVQLHQLCLLAQVLGLADSSTTA